MARKRERAMAWVGVIIFFLSSVAFSGLVLWQMNQDSSSSQSALEDALNQSQQANSTCTISSVPGGEIMNAPEVFKPNGDVTELQATDLESGDGPVVEVGDCLTVKYQGSLASDGTVFDGNFEQETLLKLAVGQGYVIKGWDEGLIGMKEGGLRRLVIPSELAYGANGSCARYSQEDGSCAEYSIEPDADLVFVVRLVGVEKR